MSEVRNRKETSRNDINLTENEEIKENEKNNKNKNEKNNKKIKKKIKKEKSKWKKHLLRLIKVAKGDYTKLFIGILAFLISSASNFALPTLIGKLMDITVQTSIQKNNAKSADMLMNSGKSFGFLSALSSKQLLIGSVGVFTLGSIASFLRVYNLKSAAQNIAVRLRKLLFRSILKRRISYFDKNKTGQVTSTLQEDIEIASETITVKIANTLRYCSSAFNGTAMLLYLSPRLTFVSLSLIPLIGIGAMLFSKYLKRVQGKYRDIIGEANSLASERISGIATVKAFSAEDYEEKKYEQILNDSKKLATNASATEGLFMSTLSLSGNISLIAVLYYGSTLVGNGMMTVGSLTTFAIHSALVGLGFSGLSSSLGDISRGLASAGKIWDIIDEEKKYNEDLYNNIDDINDTNFIHDNINGDIIFDNVTFAYPSRPIQIALNNISFHIKGNSTVAFIGKSGSGKTSIYYLLSKFYQPNNGDIYYNDINSKNLKATYIRKHIGIVEQSPKLFSGTIEDNIRYGDINATKDEIINAAKEANCHDFILQFPDGYSTQVGEHGKLLSGGELQRIAIARALLRNPSILILDEATSSLDGKNEREVLDAIQNVVGQHRTLIIITHKKTVAKLAEHIYVLKNGTIVEEGSFQELENNINSEMNHMMGG